LFRPSNHCFQSLHWLGLVTGLLGFVFVIGSSFNRLSTLGQLGHYCPIISINTLGLSVRPVWVKVWLVGCGSGLSAVRPSIITGLNRFFTGPSGSGWVRLSVCQSGSLGFRLSLLSVWVWVSVFFNIQSGLSVRHWLGLACLATVIVWAFISLGQFGLVCPSSVYCLSIVHHCWVSQLGWVNTVTNTTVCPSMGPSQLGPSSVRLHCLPTGSSGSSLGHSVRAGWLGWVIGLSAFVWAVHRPAWAFFWAGSIVRVNNWVNGSSFSRHCSSNNWVQYWVCLHCPGCQ